MEVRKDCFAYVEIPRGCKALEYLYCSQEDCKFYKTLEDRCGECKRVNGSSALCKDCERKGIY